MTKSRSTEPIMRNLLLFVLLACLGAFAQAPASVSTMSLNADSLPNMGAAVTWTRVPRATYSVYRYNTGGYATCSDSTPHNKWIPLVSGLTSTSYDDYPPGDKNGWGG